MASHPSCKVPRVEASEQIGTPEYRARHISMLWSQQLWHEAVMLVFGCGALAALFYAAAEGLSSWVR